MGNIYRDKKGSSCTLCKPHKSGFVKKHDSKNEAKMIAKDEEITEKLNDSDYVEHVICEGSYGHVLSYSTEGIHCSEPRCITNKR